MNIYIHAQVMCTDGMAGRCTHVIVEPAALQVTHLVVQENEAPHAERLVTIDTVIDGNAEGIRLNCTRRELALMDEFVERTFTRVQLPDYPNSPEALLLGDQIPEETLTVPMAEEHIPPGELAIDRNTRVEATDGKVGQVDELEVEPQSGRITCLVMREGHLWDQKTVAIPAAQIDHLEDRVAYLKLDKQSIAALPVVPTAN